MVDFGSGGGWVGYLHVFVSVLCCCVWFVCLLVFMGRVLDAMSLLI